jgi:hypothetical protein
MSRDPEAKADPKAVRLFDKRIVERNIKKGLLSRKDYEKHLKSLDDIADKGIYGGPLEDDDDDDDLRDEPMEATAPAGADGVEGAEGADEEDIDDEDDELDDEPPGSPDGNSHGP